MKVISSGLTKFYKYVFPAFWFGFLAVFLALGVGAGVASEFPLFLLVPCAMAVLGYALFRKMLWVLMDEVRDDGDRLVLRKGRDEVTVELSNIMNVSATAFVNPPQVTLRLVLPSTLGNVLVFMPVRKGLSLNPFRTNEIVEDLIVRVDKARRGRAR